MGSGTCSSALTAAVLVEPTWVNKLQNSGIIRSSLQFTPRRFVRMCHPAQLPIEQLLSDCHIEQTRRSGPGGQHRNKVQTAIVIKHLPTGIHGEASERRSQADNRRRAVQRLRINLALSQRQSSPSEPPPLWLERVKGGRIAVNPDHEDFPALLSIALDAIWAHRHAMAPSAEALQVTTSQLVKLLKIEPAALVAVNRERQARGEWLLR